MANNKLAQAIVSNRKKKDLVGMQEDATRYAALDTDTEVQKRWKDYNKIIGPKSTRWSKLSWYNLNYPEHKDKSPTGLASYSARSKRISESQSGEFEDE